MHETSFTPVAAPVSKGYASKLSTTTIYVLTIHVPCRCSQKLACGPHKLLLALFVGLCMPLPHVSPSFSHFSSAPHKPQTRPQTRVQ